MLDMRTGLTLALLGKTYLMEQYLNVNYLFIPVLFVFISLFIFEENIEEYLKNVRIL